jgi:hypothetical protein
MGFKGCAVDRFWKTEHENFQLNLAYIENIYSEFINLFKTRNQHLPKIGKKRKKQNEN